MIRSKLMMALVVVAGLLTPSLASAADSRHTEGRNKRVHHKPHPKPKPHKGHVR